MNEIKITRNFLIVVSIGLQIFSAVVSYHPVGSFLSTYITFPALLYCFAACVLIAIELGVRMFANMSFESKLAQEVRWVFAGLLVIFTGVSMTLTTIGAGSIASDRTAPPALISENPVIATYQAQLAADQERLNAISKSQAQRAKGSGTGWLTPGEEGELKAIQKRGNELTAKIAAEVERVQGANATATAKAETERATNETIHNSFGFLSQIFLLICVWLEKYLKRFEPKKHDEQVNVAQRDISVSAETANKIFDLYEGGLSQADIARKANVNRSTVNRVLRENKINGYAHV